MQCLRDSFQIQLFMQMAFDIVNCRYNIFDISWHCSFLLSRQIIAENFIPFFMYLAVFMIYKPQKVFNIPLYKFRMPADCIGYIFQQYFLLPNLNVDKNVKMGADLAGNKEYRETIKAVGLEEKRMKYPHELSGGEQQRVSVARALAKKPKVLYLDEPTGALDEATGRQVLDYICRLKKELGFTMVMVTHNQNIAQMADTVIRMNSGKIVETCRNAEQKTAYEIAW